MANLLEQATLGAGCFWCVEAVFQSIRGVSRVVSGYAGGTTSRPTYEQVCSGETGHAEVVRITFDAETVAYEDLLYVFWRTHDPTTPNRQGNDVGTQYRSVIFFHDEVQRAKAEASKKEVADSGLWPGEIITEIAPLTNFYEAEPYHQNFYRLNPDQPYCRFVIDPKIKKLTAELSDKVA